MKTDVRSLWWSCQIKADAEGSGSRSYNYRVVMMAGGAELGFVFDVSAGHRVLLLFHRFHLDKVDDEMDAFLTSRAYSTQSIRSETDRPVA